MSAADKVALVLVVVVFIAFFMTLYGSD